MGSEIQKLIRELLYGPERAHRERTDPEEAERNRREIAIQRERDERAYRKAYPNGFPADSTDTTDQRENP